MKNEIKKKLSAKKSSGAATEDKVESLDDMNKTLTPYELSQLQLHQVRAQLQSNIIENLKMKLNLLAIQYQNDQAVIRGQMKGAADSRSEANMDHNAMIAEIEARLKIKLSEYVVDDHTGILRHEDNLKQ